MKSTKLNELKKIRNQAASFITAVTLTTSACCISGCSKNKADEIQIANTVTIEDILNDINEITTVDEYLTEIGLESFIADYVVARQASDIKQLNKCLYNLGINILKASVVDTLELDSSAIESNKISRQANKEANEPSHVYCELKYNLYVDNIKPGNIMVTDKIPKAIKIKLTGEAVDVADTVFLAQEGNLQTPEDADKAFQLYQKYLLTTGKFEKDHIEFTYDDEKIEKVKTLQ